MADLFEVTAPCVIRGPAGDRVLMAEKYVHPKGILYFDLYWHLLDPSTVFHIIEGELSGSGPWKISEHIIEVLGCHGSDPELSQAWEDWQAHVMHPENKYPPQELIDAIAKRVMA